MTTALVSHVYWRRTIGRSTRRSSDSRRGGCRQRGSSSATCPQPRLEVVAAWIGVVALSALVALRRAARDRKAGSGCTFRRGRVHRRASDGRSRNRCARSPRKRKPTPRRCGRSTARSSSPAVRMTFAGLNYKIEHQDAAEAQGDGPAAHGNVPVGARSARARSGRRSRCADAHDSYLQALGTVRRGLAGDGQGRRRWARRAPDRGARSAARRPRTSCCKLSDVLWPGEYKPN